MTIPIEFIRSLSLMELRKLVVIKENQEQIRELMENRDQLLEEAQQLQKQIDEYIQRLEAGGTPAGT